MTKIATTSVSKAGKHVGWKVYLDGLKYPKKPQNLYEGTTESEAIRQAFLDAGKDPVEVLNIITV